VHSQPLWQDHLHVSSLEAQPLTLSFSFPAAQHAIITASFVKQSINSQLPAHFEPEVLLNGEVTNQFLQFCTSMSLSCLKSCMLMPLTAWCRWSKQATASASATALLTVTLSAVATASRAVLTRSLAGSCRHQLSAYWILRNQMLELCLWQS